jgi:hypothetical protein
LRQTDIKQDFMSATGAGEVAVACHHRMNASRLFRRASP